MSDSAAALARSALARLVAAASAGTAAEALIGAAAAAAAPTTAAAMRPAAEALAGVAAVRATPTATAAEVTLAVAAAVGLPDREVGRLPLQLHALDARQLRANQRAMHRPDLVIVIADTRLPVFRLVAGSAVDDIGNRFDRFVVLFRIVVVHVGLCGCGGGVIGQAGEYLLVQLPGGVALLLPRRLAALVDVLGVTRRAAGLLDVFLDHGDDGVIGHAPLTRTVIVQNVTETQPALLHVLPRIVLKKGLV